MLLRSIGFAAVALVVTTSLVSAHAQYQSSTPAANATLSTLPDVLLLTFTEELASIRVAVTGPDGSNATNGSASIDLAHRTNASIPLRNAGPGTYTVVWHNVSGDDGDPNDGSFAFTVVAPATGGAPAPAAAQPAAPVVAAAPTINDPITPGIHDIRLNTYRKRQAIRDQYQGKIDEVVFNEAVADGEGLETALADSMKK
jgi:methionine-rich copper-binding protein CopC